MKNINTIRKIAFLLILTFQVTFFFGQITVPFTTVGTTPWAVPAGVTSITIQCWGGGGGGGGARTSCATCTQTAAGGGGKGGMYSYVTSITVSSSDVVSVTVGGGGAAGAGSATAVGSGGAGGASTVSINGTVVIRALGGNGGTQGLNNAGGGATTYAGAGTEIGALYNGGNGAAGARTTTRQTGGPGGGGAGNIGDGGAGSNPTSGGGGPTGAGTAGGGGSAGGGNGGLGGTGTSAGQTAGSAGSAYGGGGGGARVYTTSINRGATGGAGGQGTVTITYTVCTNPTTAGTLSSAESFCGTSFDPANITGTLPTGHTGTLEYKWQSSTTSASAGFSDIGVTTDSYDPSTISQTTWYKRLTKVTCSSTWVESSVIAKTVNAIATAGTLQYANGSTQWICAGSTISCTNGTSPTAGSGTLSVVWYCGEEISPGNYGNWKESTLANVSGTSSSSNLNSAAGGGTGMSTSLSNYNPQSDFPSATNFLIIRRAYSSNCGVCAGGCIDQSFYLNLNPLPTAGLPTRIPAGPQFTGTTYTVSPAASGGTSPYSYVWTATPIIGGVSLSATSGTGTTLVTTATNTNLYSSASVSSFTVGYVVTDDNGCQATSLNLSPVVAPEIEPLPSFSICQGSTATTQMTTSTTIAAASGNNGSSAFNWSLTPAAGTISSSGLITWDPTFTGAATVSVYAVGAGNASSPLGTLNSAAKTGVITVSAPSVASINTAIAGTLASGDYVWNGNTNGNWATAANWYSHNGTGLVYASAAPTSASKVYIVSSATTSCLSSTYPTVNTTGNAASVFIGSGATLSGSNQHLNIAGSMTNNGTFNGQTGSVNISGNWTNNGTFTAGSGRVNFEGGTNAVISGSGNNFYDLVVNKTGSSTLGLNSAASATAVLTMTAGRINTTAVNLLTVGSSAASPGTLNWTSGTIVGPLKRFFANAANATQASGIFPVGNGTVNRYAQVNYTSAPATGGFIIAEYKAGICPIGYTGLTTTIGGQLINNYEDEGYWDIAPTGGNLNTATYTLTLFGNSLSTIGTLANTRIIKSTSHTTWDNAGLGTHVGQSGTAGSFTIVNSGMTGFSWFNIGSDNSNPLPVQLTSFSVDCNHQTKVFVNWTTVSELNSQKFVVEKSRDMNHWILTADIPAAGNSNHIMHYGTEDLNPFEGISYYRLIQVDINGENKVYGPISVECKYIENEIVVFPNPSNGNFTVEISSREPKANAQFQMIDAAGKVVSLRTETLVEGVNQILYDLGELTEGIYMIAVRSEGEETFKPVKVVIE